MHLSSPFGNTCEKIWVISNRETSLAEPVLSYRELQPFQLGVSKKKSLSPDGLKDIPSFFVLNLTGRLVQSVPI
jgi:hypothetical protein